MFHCLISQTIWFTKGIFYFISRWCSTGYTRKRFLFNRIYHGFFQEIHYRLNIIWVSTNSVRLQVLNLMNITKWIHINKLMHQLAPHSPVRCCNGPPETALWFVVNLKHSQITDMHQVFNNKKKNPFFFIIVRHK